MTRILIFILLFSFFFTLHSSAQLSPNRVVVLGTKHNGNKSLTAKSLYQTIEKINPDLILVELDSTVIRNCEVPKVWGTKTAEFLGIWKNPIEYIAARNYQQKKKTVCLIPFDIFIPNRKNYILYTSLMEQSHTNALNGFIENTDVVDTADKLLIKKYLSLSKYFTSKLDSSILVLNRPSISDTARLIMQMEKMVINRITQQYPPLKPYSNWFKSDVDFWEERNASMNNNIARELYANSGRTILILTGLLHKYAIEDFLRKKEMEKFCKLLTLEEAFMPAPVF